MNRNLRTFLALVSITVFLVAFMPVGQVQASTIPEPYLLTLQSPTPNLLSSESPQSRCVDTRGVVLSENLDSYWLGMPFPYRVYLPPCYSASLQPGYPVLYLIHGMGSNEDQWDRMGIDEAADRLVTSGQLDPFLIVMPLDNSYQQPAQDPFDEALLGELIPWIDTHYNTRSERAFRAVGGLSRGASWALHFGLTSPEVFGAVGAHSLPIFWDDAAQLSRWLESIPPEALPRLYLDIGRGDTEVNTVLQFEASLTQRNIPHEFHLNNGYHAEVYWAGHLEQYLRWYAKGWVSFTK